MAAGSTYTPIATTTLGSAASSFDFTSIPSTYTDLVIVANYSLSTTSDITRVRFNGDSVSSNSTTWMIGDGTSATSSRSISAGFMRCFVVPTSASGLRTTTLNIQNYSNSTTYKTVLIRSGTASASVQAFVGLWSSTSAITSMSFTNSGTATFDAGSTFTLYGIAAA
jgi:hypothetical protein